MRSGAHCLATLPLGAAGPCMPPSGSPGTAASAGAGRAASPRSGDGGLPTAASGRSLLPAVTSLRQPTSPGCLAVAFA
eukprot:261790-Alexandrium_andersonii.AAC.1